MMSLQEKITKLPEEQLGVELTDEEISKANGGFKEMSSCRNYVSLEDYLRWAEADGGKCNNCHLYFEFKEIKRGFGEYYLAQFYCREFGAMREGLAKNR